MPFQRVWETLTCSVYDHKNEQLLNFHIITPQIATCKAPNRFQESYNVRCFNVIKLLKSPQKAGIFRTQASIYDGVFLWMYLMAHYFHKKLHHKCSTGLYIGPRKYWNFKSENKVGQIIAVVTGRSVSCFNLNFRFN